MRELWNKIARTSAVKIYGLLIGLASLAITARWLGPVGRGELAAVLTWVGTFSTIFYFSLGQVAVRDAAKSKGVDWFNAAFGSLMFWLIITTILGLCSALVLCAATDGNIFGGISETLLVIGLVMLPFMIWERYSSFLLIALEHLDIYNRYQIFGKTAGILFLLLLVVGLNSGIQGALIASIIGQVLLSSGCMLELWKLHEGKLNLFNWAINFRYLKDGLSLHLNAIGSFLFTASDILMLNYYRGSAETGYYQLGAQLMAVMMVMPQAANMVIYGKVSVLGPDKAWGNQRKLLVQVLIFIILAALFAGMTVQWWLVWLAGESFRPSVGVFQWQLVSVVGMTFTILMSSQWVGRGYFWQAGVLTFLVGMGNIGANSLLIPVYGMYGAIWASLGVYIIAIIGNGWMVVHCQRRYIRWRESECTRKR